jgi:hypothetical protein
MEYYALNLERMSFWKHNDLGYTLNLKKAKKFPLREVINQIDYPYPGNWKVLSVTTMEQLKNELTYKVKFRTIAVTDHITLNLIEKYILS